MGPGRSSSLRIGGDSFVVSDLRRTSGASDRLVGVTFRDAPGEPPFPLDKGKGRNNEIKYPVGLEYLKSAVQNALAVGPSKVGPLYGETFARRYRPPFGVQVWSPDILCDAPKHGGPLTTRQPAEYKWRSGYPTPLQKIG